MKRRLSVACSIIGDPMIVLMDEPSTGLDPASKRQLWDLISHQKKKCMLLLTTHAMEEADALCDRLGIIVDGELKCIGASSELKQKFGGGYKVSITVTDSQYENDAKQLLLSLAPNARIINSLAGTTKYEIAKHELQLSSFFNQFENSKEKYHIRDWGISNTTLEEVFQKIMDNQKKPQKVENPKVNQVENPKVNQDDKLIEMDVKKTSESESESSETEESKSE